MALKDSRRKPASSAGPAKAILPFLVFLLTVSCSVFPTSCSSSFTSDELDTMGEIIEYEMDENGIPGSVVGVWVPGKGEWVKASGVANIETNEAMDTGYDFRIASIAKTFVATVVLQLYDEGRVDLDDPVEKYIPGIPGTEGVTLRMLLNHTSGIRDFIDDEGFTLTTERDPLKEWQHRELVEIAVSHGNLFAPGTGWHYSNTNYVLLGMIVEQVTGNIVREEISKRILNRLGLNRTYCTEGPAIPGKHSHGYADVNGDGVLDDETAINPTVGWASSSMASNLYDLKKWAEVLADGTLISRETQEERLEWVRVDPGSDLTLYGLGIENRLGFVGHEGAAFGFNCSMYYLPEKKATIVVLLNMTPADYSSANDILFGIADTLFAEDFSTE